MFEKFKSLFKKQDKPVDEFTLIIEKSLSEKIPILVGNQHNINHLRSINNSLELYGLAKGYTMHIRSREYENGVFLDDSIDYQLVDMVRNEGIEIIGFIKIGSDIVED